MGHSLNVPSLNAYSPPHYLWEHPALAVMRYLALFHPHSLKGSPMSRTPKPLMSASLIEWILTLPMAVPSCAVPAMPVVRRNVVAEFILSQG